MNANTGDQHLVNARRALSDHRPEDFREAMAVASAHALVSIAESLTAMNRTLERVADE